MLRFPLPQPGSVVAFSPDDRLLAVASPAGPDVRLFDAYTGRVERVLYPPAALDPVRDLAFAPDGLRLAVRHGGEPDAINVWSVSAGRWLCALPDSVVPPAFLPDGKRVVTVGGMQDPDEADPEWCRLWVWHALSGNLDPLRLRFGRGPLLKPVAVVAPADGPLGVVQADRVRHFDRTDGTELAGMAWPERLTVTEAAGTAGGLVLRAHQTTGRWLGRRWWRGFGVVDADGFRPAARSDAPPGAWAASPDGRRAVWADGDTVRAVDLLGGGSAGVLDPGLGPVSAVAYSADGLRLAAVGRTAAVWDADG